MVEFLSLFLGVTVGIQPVELNVAGPVAAVEIQLDGETLTTLTGAPWVFECDLGDGPMPHDLVAIARDSDGRELDRASQWINLGARRTAATLAVRADSSGRVRSLAVGWESIGQPEPEGIEVSFDGQPLDTSDPDHIPLPPHAGGEFHYVSANVRFSSQEDNRRETDFGSVRATEVSTELTAVVVQLEGRKRLPAARAMHDWFQKGGVSIPVHGVEKGDMDLYVVRAPAAQPVLDRVAQAVVRNSYRADRKLASLVVDWHPQRFFSGGREDGEPEHRIWIRLQQLEPLRRHGSLSHNLRIAFLSPRPGPLASTGLSREMFAWSRRYTGAEGGLIWLAQREPAMDFAPQTTAAVALAGLKAHAGNRRRAVLLITAGTAEDTTEYTSEMARLYLEALGVPLYIWSFADDPGSGSWTEGAHALGDPAKPVAAARELARASKSLQRDLTQQRVIWLEGRHLPHQITLGPQASGVRLVSAETVTTD